MKKLSSKAKRVLNYSGLFLAVFGITATCAYFMIPSNVRTAGTDSPDDSNSQTGDDPNVSVDPMGDMTPTERLVSKLASGISGIKADVNFSATLLNSQTAEDGTVTYNKGDVISISNTPLYFAMPSLEQISLAFNPTIVYATPAGAATAYETNKTLDLTLLDQTLYMSCLGLNYKCSIGGFNQILSRIAEAPFNLDMDGVAEKLSSSFSTSTLTDALSKMTYVAKSDKSGYAYNLALSDCTIFLESDNDYNVTRAYAKDINVKNVADLSFDVTIAEEKEIANDIVEPSNSADYSELFNMVELAGDVYSLVKTPRFGINGSLKLTEPITATHTTAANSDINVTVNANADIDNKLIGADVDLTCGSTTQTLDIAYLKDKGAFLDYNKGIKLSTSYADMDSLIGQMKGSSLSSSDKAKVDKLFGFITQSEVMSAISGGHYQKVVDMIEKVESGKNNYLNLTISLTGLGLGDSAKLVVTAEDAATTDANNATVHNLVAGVSFADVQLKQFTLSGAFNYQAYQEPSVDETVPYQKLDMLPTVWNQAYSLYQTPQAYVSLTGSVMDRDIAGGAVKTGFSFGGNTEFDIAKKMGTGTITIHNQTEKFKHDHYVDIDVQGDESGSTDGASNAMLFTYGSSASSNKLKGKNTIKTLNDIIDTVKTLMKTTDPRYTKFLEPVKTATANTVINMLVSGNYSSLVENKILTAVVLTSAANGTETTTFTIDPKLLGTKAAFTVSLTFDAAKKLSSLSVADLSFDMTINSTKIKKDIDVTLELGTYDSTKLQHLSTSDTYMDFSQISVLVDFGINTSAPAYWHLTATAGLNFGFSSAFNVSVSLNFYIHVDGAKCEVVGYLTDLPAIVGVNANILGKRKVTFVYSQEKIYLYGDSYWSDLFGDHPTYDYHYYTADYFTNNIVTCLCGDALGLKETWLKKITTSSSGSDSDPIPFENILKSFAYDDGSTEASKSTIASYNKKHNATAEKLWTIDTDIGVLARNTDLKDLQILVGGSTVGTENYLTSAYVKLSIVAGISITVTADVKSVDIGVDFATTFSSSSDYAKVIKLVSSKASLQQ